MNCEIFTECPFKNKKKRLSAFDTRTVAKEYNRGPNQFLNRVLTS